VEAGGVDAEAGVALEAGDFAFAAGAWGLEAGVFALEAGDLALEAGVRACARCADFIVATRFFDIITPSDKIGNR
jgi:hypothetical protein